MSEKRQVNKIFVERLRLLMNEKGLTQQILADELKTSRKTISLWCIGRGFPTSNNLDSLLRRFNVSKAWLIGESENRNEKFIEERISELEKQVAKLSKQGEIICQTN